MTDLIKAIDIFDIMRGMRLSHARMEAISQPGRDMSYLLMHGHQNPDFDPVQCSEWMDWWSQHQNDAWGPMIPSRTQLRKLDLHHLNCVQIGLHFKKDVIHQNGPLLDRGVLHRMSGTKWTRGLQACLEKLEDLDPSRAKHLWLSAICNANEHGKAQNARILLNWAFSRNHKSWISPDACAQTLLLFSEHRQIALRDADIEKLFSLTDTSSIENEKAIWSAIVSSENKECAARALSAWCGLSPGVWDRMHHFALEDSAVPNAWLLACIQAKEEGFESPLWKVASSSQDVSIWMKRLDWGLDDPISPLGQWWVHQCSAADEAEEGAAPGDDPVSVELRRLGAPEPGSSEEMSLGGAGFVCGLMAQQVDPNWFSSHPHWLLNCQGKPISRSKSASSLDTWIKCGFDPAEVDAKGNMAIVNFLSGNLSKKRKSIVNWLRGQYEKMELPSQGSSASGTLIDRLSILNDEGLMMAWLGARLSGPHPPSPSETENLAYMSSAPVIRTWCLKLKDASQWNEAHHHALWRGMIMQDRNRDAEIWEDLAQSFPFSEDDLKPVWVLCIEKAEFFCHCYADLKNTLNYITQSGGSSISALSPVWQQSDFISHWHVRRNLDGSDGSIAPTDADIDWWELRLSEWFSADESVVRNQKEMEGWLRVGLPLEGVVLNLLHERWLREKNQCNANAWFYEPLVVSALELKELSDHTPSITSHKSRSRRF